MAQAELVLTASLDISTAAALKASLLAVKGQPLQIEATSVERVGTAGLQVLLAGATAWRNDGLPLHYINTSAALVDGLELAGLTLSDISSFEGAELG